MQLPAFCAEVSEMPILTSQTKTVCTFVQGLQFLIKRVGAVHFLSRLAGVGGWLIMLLRLMIENA